MLELKAGDTYIIPSHVEHGAAAGPDGATVVDVFAPIREDWDKLERLEPAAGVGPSPDSRRGGQAGFIPAVTQTCTFQAPPNRGQARGVPRGDPDPPALIDRPERSRAAAATGGGVEAEPQRLLLPFAGAVDADAGSLDDASRRLAVVDDVKVRRRQRHAVEPAVDLQRAADQPWSAAAPTRPDRARARARAPPAARLARG